MMKKIIALHTIVIFIISHQFSCSSQDTRTIEEKLEQDLGPKVKKFMGAENIPGLAIGIIKGENVLYLKGFGVKNIDTKERITDRTLFHMASVSKTFVSTAIMQLFEKEKIKINDTVITHLPYFKLNDNRYKNITIGQLLSHTSGMPDYNKKWINQNHYRNPEFDKGALERYVRSLSEIKMIASPGKEFHYSNIAYNVIGYIIAKISGKPFEEYQRESILSVLKMNDSSFLLNEIDIKRLATPYRLNQRGALYESKIFPYHRAHAPNGTLFSNIREMCNFMIAHINKGNFEDATLLNPETYNILWEPQEKIRRKQYMSFGWFILNFGQYKIISHSGGDLGYSTGIVLIPEKSIGYVMMCNLSNAPLGKISYPLLKILL